MALKIAAFETSDCITSTYGTLVQYLGGEPAIFGSQWGYRSGTNKDVDWPFERLNASRRTPCELMADWHDLDVVWTRNPDWESAWRQIRTTLDAGQPVIVVADAFQLAYCWQYQKQHSPHRIVLNGYADDVVEISDGYRGSLHRGPLPLTMLQSAMTSSGLLYPRRMYTDGRNTVITVPRPGTPLDTISRQHTRESIVQNVLQYVPGGAADEDSGHGLLVRCAAEIRDDAAGLADRTTGDVSEVSAWFGGMASQRALNSVFLHWAAETLAVPALHHHADEATAVSRRWEKLRNYLYIRLSPQARSRSTVNGRSTVERVAEIVEETARHELSWCRALGDEIGCLENQPLTR